MLMLLTWTIWEQSITVTFVRFDVIWANWLLYLITIEAQFIVMLFSIVGQTKVSDLFLTRSDDNIRWKFFIWVILPRFRLESVIPKVSECPHRCGDWQPHILLKILDLSVLELCRCTTHVKKIIPQITKIAGLRDGNKEAKLTDSSFNYIIYVYLHCCQSL